jgi:NitT/TauT family transport system ATP-binding protein
MVQSLAKAQVDGFCVGAPWNAAAVEAGVGRIIHQGRDLVRNCPEKVFAFRADFAKLDPDALVAASRAVRHAAAWAAEADNAEEFVAITAREIGLEVPPLILRAILDPTMAHSNRTCLLRVDVEATHIRPAHATWLYQRMAEAGQLQASPETEARALSVYRPDLSGDALQETLSVDDLLLLEGASQPD